MAWSAGGALQECVTQDLRLGEEGKLEAGDSVEIKYTAHELTDHALSDVIDRSVDGDRATRFKVGRGRTIKVRDNSICHWNILSWHRTCYVGLCTVRQAFDEHLIGAQRGSRRLILSPASHAGKLSKVGATIAFDVQVVRVRI